MINKIFNEDCLEWMKRIPDGSIDCIITDPPYWTTACKWDSVIDFDLMWAELKRIIKPNWAIVLFGSEPFSSALRMSNIKQYKYDWIWNKKLAWAFMVAKYRPLPVYENIIVFSDNKTIYNPQMIEWKMRSKKNKTKKEDNEMTDSFKWLKWNYDWWTYNMYYPKNIIDIFPNTDRKWKMHPTQKPVALIEYLIKTYTNEWETVLDFTIGSGTTAIACINTNRNYIGFEMDKTYFDIAQERIRKHKEINKLQYIWL